MEDLDYMIGPIRYTLDAIGGKWKPLILYYLLTEKVKRYGHLKKSLPGITHKMLSSQLKELEAGGLIIRKEYAQVPPKVEYSLAEKGVTLIPLLSLMYAWGEENMR